MAINNRRNYSFDFLKLFFTLIIILHHSLLLSGVMVRGYIVVEFFFFVSGYFICSKTKNNIPLKQYVKSRIKKLYPGYLCAFVLIFLVFLTIGKLSYQAPYGPFLELFLLQNVGIPRSGGINFPLWYLSVLFYGGAFIYLAKRTLSDRWFHVIGGIVVALTYGFLLFQIKKVQYWETVGGIFYIPFWRGVSDLIIGTWIYQMPKLPARSGKGLQLISFFAAFALLFIPGKLDFITIALLAALVYSSASQDTVLDRIGKMNLFRKCYEYQYFAYLNHALAIYGNSFLYDHIAARHPTPVIIQALTLVCIVSIMAFGTKKATDYMVNLLCHWNRGKTQVEFPESDGNGPH